MIPISKNLDGLNGLTERDAAICGGFNNLYPCGGVLPSTFCCQTSRTCLVLNTTDSVRAAICCPADLTCAHIGPISCDKTLQNATLFPESQIHSDPPPELSNCGSGCCPPGYTCQNTQCVADTPPAKPTKGIVNLASRSTSGTRPRPTTTSNADATSTSSPATKSTSTLPTRANPSASSTSSARPPRLNATGKAVIGVLAALIWLLILGFGGWYLYRRREKRTAAEARARKFDLTYDKVELEGTGTAHPAELDGLRSPRELPAHPKRCSTLNSAPRELDVAPTDSVRTSRI